MTEFAAVHRHFVTARVRRMPPTPSRPATSTTRTLSHQLGQQDARRLAERLAALPVDLVVSSSYLRARTTAGLIAEATSVPHVVP